MMNFTKHAGRSAVAAAAIVAFVGMSPAFAADAVFEEPPAPMAPVEMAPAVTWAGPYLGLYGGYGFEGQSSSIRGDVDEDGFIGGVFGGWNFQNGGFVYGVEADAGYNNKQGFNGVDATQGRFEGSLRGRLGYAVTDRVLVYGTAGAAAQQLKYMSPGFKDENGMVGWTAGAGVDAMLTDNVFGRIEYRYTDFGNSTFATAGGPTSIDNRDNRVTFGIGMKF
jgi:outer membrane immunogenic protein